MTRRFIPFFSAIIICLTIGCTAPSPANPDSGKDPADTTSHNPVDTTWNWVNGYPKGVTVESFTWNFNGKVCKGFKAEIDFKANPALLFNTTKASGLKKTSEQFASLAKVVYGKPVLATNGGYFAGATSVSMVVLQGFVKQYAWRSFNWPNDENYQCSLYPPRSAIGQMPDGHFEIQWAYCTDISHRTHLAYPDISKVGNNEKTRTFRSTPPDNPEEFPGSFVWEPYNAIGGGPRLVKDGRNVAEECYWYESLDSGGTAALSYVNRTAIGIKDDGKIVLIVCDGRGANGSNGITLPLLADKFIELGCKDAMNLDGGGSSTMVGSDGKVLNHPSDASGERKVSSVIIITEKR